MADPQTAFADRVMDPQTAFADAVARARVIAAKIHNPPGPAGGDSINMNAGKPQFDSNTFSGQFGQFAGPNSTDQSRAIDVQQLANRVNQQLGISPPTKVPGMLSTMGPPSDSPGLQGMPVTEDYPVPDKLVGLIIGKGGEQITRVQAETGCKIQIAPDAGGLNERSCTLTGSPVAISNAKQEIQKIIERAQAGLPRDTMPMGFPGMMGGGGDGAVEMQIPGNKVGLIIGKGGETIKQLQERAGVKMVMIQDSNIPSQMAKPLRISGEPDKCQRAREMVIDLMNEKDGDRGMNGYGVYSRGGMDIQVPRPAVGIVIGKGGDMIKKIQSETGAKVQFKQDDGAEIRICSLQGPQDKVEEANQMISELLEKSGYSPGQMGGENPGMMGGPMPGRGGGRFDNSYEDRTTFAVPADKCGLVIGKGGETIKQINQQSGAHVELQRQAGPNPNEKVFNIRGEPSQIQMAIQMIAEKAGVPYEPDMFQTQSAGPLTSGPGPQGGPPQGGSSGPSPTGPAPYGGPSPPTFDQFAPPSGGPGPSPAGPSGTFPGGPPQQGWGGTYNQQFPQPQGTPQPGDPSKMQQDPNAAAWAAYYAQYYAQYGQYGNQQPGQPGQPPQQPGQPLQQPGQPLQQPGQPLQQPGQPLQQPGQPPQQPGQPPQQQPSTQSAPTQPQQQPQQPPTQNQPQPTVNPVTGQPDYSAAWAEYYRQQGLHQQANMIMQQYQQQQQQFTGTQAQPQPQQQPAQ